MARPWGCIIYQTPPDIYARIVSAVEAAFPGRTVVTSPLTNVYKSVNHNMVWIDGDRSPETKFNHIRHVNEHLNVSGPWTRWGYGPKSEKQHDFEEILKELDQHLAVDREWLESDGGPSSENAQVGIDFSFWDRVGTDGTDLHIEISVS